MQESQVFSRLGPFYDKGLMLEISKFLSLQNMTIKIANNADPDEIPHFVASHQGLHCFLIAHVWDSRHQWIKFAQPKSQKK